MKIQDFPTNSFIVKTADLEARVPEGEQSDLRLWLRLLSCTTLIENEIRSRLRREFKTTLPRFELMAQLSAHPDGLMMTTLSRNMLVTNGNITGITDQLEKEGLVERQRQNHDRRSSVLKLTPEGEKQYQRMAAAHEEWIRGFLGPLCEANKEMLASSLSELKMVAHLQVNTPAQ